MSTKKINGVYITTPKQQSDPGGGVPEAPKDGHIYGRKNGDWEKVQDGGESHPYLSLERLRRYLYRVTFDQLSEDNGGDNAISGGCSSYVKDGKLYRNLDFKYDNAASFIVRTRDFEGMSFITGLNDGEMDDELIAQLPYRIVDGRNNSGIMVSTHVLFNDWSWTGSGERSISLTRLPFLALSRVKSMATIATDLADVLENLYASEGLQASGYLLQVLVSDGTTTYAILPPTSAGQSYVLQDITANPKLANFRWVLAAQVDREDMDLQARPTGIERFNAMPCALADLRFTKAYEDSDRLSEFIGIDGTTKASSDAELLAIYQLARAEYLDRHRDGETWQTMHSVVYGDKMEHLCIQENWSDDIVASGVSKEYVDGIFTELESNVGDLDDLNTEDKTSLVGAINEVKGKIPVPVTIATTITPQSTNTDAAGAAAVYAAATTPIVAGEQTAVTVAMDCGKKYKYMDASGIASLAFTLNAPTDATKANIWYIKFRSGATATNVSFPSGLWYPNGTQPSIEANTIYEIMIDEDYCLTMQAYKQLSA